jgi:hypothetical protein
MATATRQGAVFWLLVMIIDIIVVYEDKFLTNLFLNVPFFSILKPEMS